MFGYFWHRIPFFRFLIPLILGILTGFYTDSFQYRLVTFLVLILSVFTIQVFLKSIHIRSFFQGLLIFILFIFLGFLISYQFKSNQEAAKAGFNQNIYVIKLKGLPSLKANRIKCLAEVFHVDDFKFGLNPFAHCIVVFDSSYYNILKGGDCFYLNHSDLKEIQAALNPGEFNYKNYLSFKGIHHQVDFTKSTAKPFLFLEPTFPENYSIRSQIFIRQTLQTYLPLLEHRSVALALLYGYDDEISKELGRQYAVTGTLHVLAVSGMHVGLVFLFLEFVLAFLDKRKPLKIIKALFILACIWFYSLLCGLSPSILRAAVMISFFVVSKLLERAYNPVNTLSASAFFMLLFNPSLLFDAGFQLSYFAVLGLSLFYQSIYFWYEPKSWLADQIWKLIAASTAAQITTFPLSLLYFHQFPILFPLSNLLIIPLSTFAIYAGIALLVFSFHLTPASYISLVLKALIGLSNYLASYLASLPFCSVNEIYISLLDCTLLFAMVFFLMAFLYQKQYWHLKGFLYLILLFFVIQLYIQIQQSNKSFVRVYAYAGQTCLLIADRGNVCLLGDSIFVQKQQTIELVKQEFPNVKFRNLPKNYAYSIQVKDCIFSNQHHFFKSSLPTQRCFFLQTSPKNKLPENKIIRVLNLTRQSLYNHEQEGDTTNIRYLLKSGAFEVLL